MKKRWFMCAACLLVLLCALCIPVRAYGKEGTWGSNLRWSYEDGTLTISGTGEMKSDEFGDYPWSGVCSSVNEIVIEDEVTSIAYYAFANCQNLTEVTIGTGVKRIEASAFEECSKLKTIVIPDNVTEIEGMAFRDCESLEEVSLGSGLVSLGGSVFRGCIKLKNVEIPDGVTSIDNYAFYECESLESVIIPNSIAAIGDSAFYKCTSLKSLMLPDGVKRIGDHAFNNCKSLENVDLPDSLLEIGDHAFYYCNNLKSIVMPDSVSIIGCYAFYGCKNMERVVIPGSVTEIGDYAFNGCENLSDVTIGTGVSRIGQSAFVGCNDIKNIEIPDSVTEMAIGAFWYCENLTDITIGSGIRTIGKWAFRECPELRSVTFKGNAPDFDGEVFAYTQVTCYYRAGDKTWENHIGNNYGGNVTWVPCETLHNFTEVVTPPSGNESGYTTYTCECGFSYVGTGEEKPGKEPFNESKYRADQLLNEYTGYDLEYYTKLVNDGSLSQMLYGTGELKNANDVWHAVTVVLDTFVKGDAAIKHDFAQSDLYEALLLNALEAATDTDVADSWVISTEKKLREDSSKMLGYIKDSLEFQIDWKMAMDQKVSQMTADQKKAFRESLTKAVDQDGILSDVTYVKKCDTLVNSILEFAVTVEDAVLLYLNYANLWSMTDSMADVLIEMYNQTPDDAAHKHMRDALSFCSKMIRETSEKQFKEGILFEAMDKSFSEYAITQGISLAWKMVKENATKSSAKLAVLLFVYDMSRAAANYVAGADAISEQTFKVEALNEYYQSLNPAIEALADRYQQDRTERNADALLSAIMLLFGFGVEDCDTACGFADAVDDALIYKLQTVLDWLKGSNQETGAERMKRQAKEHHKFLLKEKDLFDTVWIASLRDNYPDIFPQYSELIGIKPEKPLVVKITNSYEIACPVDVLVYDSEGNLVVDLSQETYYFGDGINALRVGDKKYIDVSDDSQYTIQCVGYDEGTMDVTVRMYNGLDEVRTASFNDLPVTDGVTYELVTKLDPEDGVRHEISDGEETIYADEDSGAEEPETEIVWGDANGDETVDYLDAMLALRHAVKLITLSEDVAARCDVDASGGIDYLDAMLILRKAVKLISEFPVETK